MFQKEIGQEPKGTPIYLWDDLNTSAQQGAQWHNHLDPEYGR